MLQGPRQTKQYAKHLTQWPLHVTIWYALAAMVIIEIIPIGHWNRYLVNKYHVPGTVLDLKDKQVSVPAY